MMPSGTVNQHSPEICLKSSSVMNVFQWFCKSCSAVERFCSDPKVHSSMILSLPVAAKREG
jgi:hypothetical protein